MSDSFFIILLASIALWLLGLSVYLYKVALHYQRLTDGVTSQNLASVLEKILNNQSKTKKITEELEERLNLIALESKLHVQKVGILRFNPFADTGGNQSFVLAILDGNCSGVVLTSLHARGITRWYVNCVKQGKGVDHELSKEEVKAIKNAVRLKQDKNQ